MSAKLSEKRRAAFLRALEATANITLSAERTCVSRSWVLAQRKCDAAFDAACVAALAAAKARLGAHTERRPPKGWGHLDGVELVVRGTGGAALRDAAGAAPLRQGSGQAQDGRKSGRRVQIARARAHQFSPAVEDRFLATLAATCNAKAAMAEVGMSKGAAYTHRKRWPAFARKWDEAIETAYARIELALVANGGNMFSASELPPEAPIPPMTVDQAMHLLHMHKYEVREIGRRPGGWARRPTLAEVAPGIIRKVEAIKRGRNVSAADKARGERDYAARRPPK